MEKILFELKKSDINTKIDYFNFYLKNHDLYQPW